MGNLDTSAVKQDNGWLHDSARSHMSSTARSGNNSAQGKYSSVIMKT